MNYLDFDLLIERSGDKYKARVVNSPAGQATIDFSLPFSNVELENFILKIGRPRQGVRRVDSPQMAAAKAFGKSLFKAIFEDQVWGCLLSSLDEATRQGCGLRLKLRMTNVPELANIPWEFLYNPSLDRFLVLSIETPLVRYLDLPERLQPLEVKLPLRLLVMIANPHDHPKLKVEQEWVKLKQALGDLERHGIVELERLDEATLTALQRRLRRKPFHIFHFIGHGHFDEQDQDGVLILEDENKMGRPVSGNYLGTLMHDERTLRLAFLNACEGARTSCTDPFSGAAQSLVQQGIPAVIAMQFEVTDKTAVILAREFYAALSDGYPVDAALAEARKAIFAQANDVEWGTPVLYMRAPDGRIFDIQHTQDALKTIIAEERPPASLLVQQGRQIGRIYSLQAGSNIIEKAGSTPPGSDQSQVSESAPVNGEARKTSSKTLWTVLAAVAIMVITGVLFLLPRPKPADKNDLFKQATAAQRAMIELKTEAQRFNAETWVDSTFKLALETEQRGDKELAEGNDEAAIQTYDVAGDLFKSAAQEADRKMTLAENDLNKLKEIVTNLYREMVKEKVAAEKAGAATTAKALYDNALKNEQEGDRNFEGADRDSYIAAQRAYANAREGYKKARAQAEQFVVLGEEAEAARTEMNKAKQQVPGDEKARIASDQYNQAMELENAGKRQFQAGDFGTARNSFRQAKALYLEAMKNITENLPRSQANAAKESMLQAKAKISQDGHSEVKYQEAIKIETEAESAFSENKLDRAAELYQAAEKLYIEIDSETKRKIETAHREIQILIDRYKESFQNRDVQALKTLFKDKGEWTVFFKVAKYIRVDIEDENIIELRGNIAKIDLSVKIWFYNTSTNKDDMLDLPYQWTLEKISGQWFIVHSAERK